MVGNEILISAGANNIAIEECRLFALLVAQSAWFAMPALEKIRVPECSYPEGLVVRGGRE
jgi:hypothetical protein